MTTRTFGSGIRRREDPRLITGAALYTDDITLPGMLHAAFLRSPYAHAKINSIDTAEAKKAPGVAAVYTAADVEGHLQPMKFSDRISNQSTWGECERMWAKCFVLRPIP